MLPDHLTQVFAWLDPTAPAHTPLADLRTTTRRRWDPTWDERSAAVREPLLFPLLYTAKPQLNPTAFHQLVDSACEAARLGTHVLLVSVPAARRGPSAQAAERVKLIAAAFADHGFDVRAGGDATTTHPADLVGRTCGSPMNRRTIDQPGLLVTAAADTAHTTHVVLSDGLAAGEQLRSLRLHAPWARLHDPRNPFAPPPPGAKRPPAGTDALWASALTLELTDTCDGGVHTESIGTRLGPLWHRLLTTGLVGQRTAPPQQEPTRLHSRTHALGDPVTVPLFGAPALSQQTRTLITCAALAGPITLVIDDLTPPLVYTGHDPAAVRDLYTATAHEHGGDTVFLSDLDRLPELLNHALETLTLVDLHRAVGPRSHRVRGHLTAFDALHLAVMGLACTQRPQSTLALKAANAADLRALTPMSPPSRTLTVTGHASADDTYLQVPAHWATTRRETHS
ncbi:MULTISPECIES: hypothetical protein [Nocardiopsis]|uniref:Uncharacterized protein n=3 Tax=Nocardiopsis TaxID=2013 RepID=A0A840WK94_9ACTN|nr:MULTISPECIES: hypothetical protein [Nocardiopsis]MBB5493411.1 hypothetical protein [Nocardiopsis metallicus]MCK9873028.1 hypothetical protein [Nocardiopsis dassonvillei]MEE2051624.1 hypothetical protein [Nocardiopsis umidischolae]